MIKVTIPIKTVSEANTYEHWTKSSKRHKIQKDAVRVCLNGKLGDIRLSCKIKVTRIAPRRLDKDENLPMSLKWIVDAVCDIIKPGLKPGQADSDPGFDISYYQRKGDIREYQVEIEVENNMDISENEKKIIDFVSREIREREDNVIKEMESNE